MGYVHTSAGTITCPDLKTAIAVAMAMGNASEWTGITVIGTSNTPTMPELVISDL